MSKKLLQVEHLSIALKNPYQDLVKDISFSLEEAGAVILLGQSGSGKTMTCRAILGLLNSSAFQVNGEIFFDNRSLLQLKENLNFTCRVTSCGALDVVLYDADTGEELSRSVGTMDYIVPDQYTTLGMDPP